MAEEEKKPKRSEKMYGKGPKIEAEREGDKVKSEGGAPKEANAEADKTAGDPPSHVETSDVGKSGTEAKGDVMAGTDGIETHHVHSGERMQMHGRHMLEAVDMAHRHDKEHMLRVTGNHGEDHGTMNGRHNSEFRSMHTRHEQDHRALGARQAGGPSAGIEEKEVGPSGTNKD